MKNQNKDMVKSIAVMAGSLILLICGSFTKEFGQEGKGIVLIMCSLYMAMWVHAGIVGTSINAKFEGKKEQAIDSDAVEKSASKKGTGSLS